MATYKKVSEIVKALETRIPDDKIAYREGAGGKSFGYVPWDVSLKEMNSIFGVFGWEETNLFEFHDTEKGIYAVTKQITILAADDEHGGLVRVSKVGKGRAVNDKNPDMAISAADSDAFSRAVKKLGDAFGSFLYDKSDPARQAAPTGNTTQRTDTRQTGSPSGNTSKGNGEGKPTEKQVATLKKAGCPDSEIAGLSFGDASALITKIAGNGWKWDASFGSSPTGKKSTPKPAPKATEDADDLDEFFGN